MMLLIALAITVAFFASWAASLHWVDHTLDFWWELALLIVIMLLGHWIEMRSLSQTSSALDSLAALLPDEAERVVGESVETVPTAALATGDLVIVRPGARAPSDGTVVEGSADMDESMITGESKTVRRTVGDQVVAGTVATTRHFGFESPPWEKTPRSPVSGAWSSKPELVESRAGVGGQGRCSAVLVRTRRGSADRDRLEYLGHPGERSHPDDHRSGDRLPARARVGDSTGRLDRDGTGGSGWDLDHRPHGPRGDA